MDGEREAAAPLPRLRAHARGAGDEDAESSRARAGERGTRDADRAEEEGDPAQTGGEVEGSEGSARALLRPPEETPPEGRRRDRALRLQEPEPLEEEEDRES